MGKIILNNIEYGIGISNGYNIDITNLVEKDDIVTVIDDTCTDEEIPSAKAVYDKLSDLPTDSGSKCYTSLEALGLTADATIDDVIDALKEGETALISTNEFTNYKDGMFPNQCANDQYAVVKVEKESGSKVFLEWRQKEGNAYAIGGLNSSNKFTNWNNLVRFKKDGYADDSIICIGDAVSNDGVIQTLANLGFSNDIMTWNTGVYRVSHVSGLTGLPSDITNASPAFRLEHHDIKKWGGNHNPLIKTWAQRHSIIYCDNGNVYQRFYESGATAGVFTKDTGWQKIQTSGKYYNINHLNSAKGTSIELVANTDNTLKIVEALGEGEEFVEWFRNGNDRFGLGTNAGSKINYIRIQKTDATNAIILAITDYGKTFTRICNDGTLGDWCWDKSKGMHLANTANFKLDVTKRNSAWLGSIKVTYLYDSTPSEIEIYFKGESDDLRWAVTNGQNCVKQITFTQDSSNKAHYTIGIEFTVKVYGSHQAEVVGSFADIDSFGEEVFTGEKTATRIGAWGKNNSVTLVGSPENLGLTYPCTTVQIAQAMKNRFNLCGAIAIFDNGDRKITDAPSEYGLLQVNVYGYDRVMIRYDSMTSGKYAGSWIGKIKGSNGTFSSVEWERIDGVVSTGGEPAVYSTSEQAIGTWVDGKTIYRKTIVKDTHAVNAQLITGVDTFIRGYGTCERAGYVYNVPHCGLLAGHLQDEDVPYLNFKLDANGALSTIGSSMYNISKLKVTLEYTKK